MDNCNSGYHNYAKNIYHDRMVNILSHYIATCNEKLGIIYFQSGKLDKAIKYYEHAVEIRKLSSDYLPEEYLCIAPLDFDEMEKVKHYYQQAVKIDKECGIVGVFSSAFDDIGMEYCRNYFIFSKWIVLQSKCAWILRTVYCCKDSLNWGVISFKVSLSSCYHLDILLRKSTRQSYIYSISFI